MCSCKLDFFSKIIYNIDMYEFFEENRKYRVICTEDRKHAILVNHTPEELAEYAQTHNLTLTDPTERLYVVHESVNREIFMFSILTLTRRLDPLGTYGSMFPWFYRTKVHELIVKGVYIGTPNEPSPFKEVPTTLKGLTPLSLPHA